MLLRLILVATGGALGSVCRYLLSRAVQGTSTFPIGTFAVNMLGCVAVGVFAGRTLERGTHSEQAWLFLVVGLCGGFTTFSAFSYETLKLLQSGQVASAGLNAGGQLVLGLAAVWMGLALARWF